MSGPRPVNGGSETRSTTSANDNLDSANVGSPKRLSLSRLEAPLRNYAPKERVADNYIDLNKRVGSGTSLDSRGIPDSPKSEGTSPTTAEHREIVKRHLVSNEERKASQKLSGISSLAADINDENGQANADPNDDANDFSSLHLQSGDITRQLYQFVDEESNRRKHTRSHSFEITRPKPPEDRLNVQTIRVPGGFRRNYLQNKAASQAPDGVEIQPTFLTRNFIEFLSIYGHFAGEDLDEEDESSSVGEFQDPSPISDGNNHGNQERQPLLRRKTSHKRSSSSAGKGQAGFMKATLLLLKSFVGTGILFLPRAFRNGGMLFSAFLLVFVAMISMHNFILLTKTRTVVPGSFGDIGGALWGPRMRISILFSVVVSQLGFAAAYIVFVSSTIRAFLAGVSGGSLLIDAKWLIFGQAFVFIPLALVRKISTLSASALVADVFILFGLIVLYVYDASFLAANGIADIRLFNSQDFALFIGTSIFTFEGIGLILPIQQEMKRPEQFPRVLGIVMIIVTTVFTTAGVFSYAAFGSAVQTVVILNLPDGKFTRAVQLLYSIAILLSAPIQMFPAIRIVENSIITKSGKFNTSIKWKKNFLRVLLVIFTICVAYLGSSNLDRFVSVVGTFCCIPLVYIYPPMLHYRACSKTKWLKAADIIMGVFGSVAMIFTMYMTIANWDSS